MRIVRRRVMRSAGASTIGKRTNLAAMLGAHLSLLMSALPTHECSLSFLGVQCGCEETVCQTLALLRSSSKAKTQTLGLLASVLHDASSANFASAFFTAAKYAK